MPEPKKVRTTHGSKESTIFDDKVKEVQEAGRFKGVVDADKRLSVIVTKAHVTLAKRKDESACVVALGAGATIDEETYLSIGGCIAKVLYYERGIVKRYMVPRRLRKAIDHFDSTGEWNLVPGEYFFLPPKGASKLTKNKTREEKEQDRKRWSKFKQTFERSGTAGTGINEHRSRPLPQRQVTILKA